jgi:chitodextrinase
VPISAHAATITYEHDPATGRIQRAIYDDGTIVVYNYDDNGNRTRATVTPGVDTTAPEVPTGLTATPISMTQVNLSWADSIDNRAVTGYRLQRCAGTNCTSYAQIATTTTTTYQDTGRSAGSTYRYRVSAYDAAGNASAYSAPFNVTTLDTVPPSAPGTPIFSNIAMNSATASWPAATDNAAVTGYQYRLNSGSWITLGNVQSVNLTGLTAVRTYTFEVRAKDKANNAGPSSSGSFTTIDTAAPTAPGAPTFSNLTATSATVNWTAATDNIGVTGYRYRLNAGAWQTLGNVTTVNLTALSSSVTYAFEVQARDAAGNFGAASSGSFQLSDATPPSAPGTPTFTNLTMTSATANWAAATDNVDVTSYEYRFNSGGWQPLGEVLTVPLTGLSPATTYSFEVRARDGANNIGPASSESFTTPDTAVPSAPGTPTFTNLTQTSATASWTAATDNVGVTGYQWRVNGGTWQTLGNVLTVNIPGLTVVTSYTFDVRARDAAGNWGNASSGTFTTPDTSPPSAPGTPTFSNVAMTSATASWGAASDNVGVTGYRYRLNGSGWTELGNVTSVNLAPLTVVTNYTFELQARDGYGNWGNSASGSFTTPDTQAPGAPGTPGFSSITTSSATASWGAASDNVGVTGYEYRLNGGSWVGVGNVSSFALPGLSSGSSYTFDVRARDAAGNAGAASSGSFSTLATITISDRTVQTQQSGGTTASFVLTSGGDIGASQQRSPTAIDVGDWLAPKVGMSGFEALATLSDNTTCSSGPIGTWVNLGTNVSWTSTYSGGFMGGSKACVFILQIRHVSNQAVILGSAKIVVVAVNAP